MFGQNTRACTEPLHARARTRPPPAAGQQRPFLVHSWTFSRVSLTHPPTTQSKQQILRHGQAAHVRRRYTPARDLRPRTPLETDDDVRSQESHLYYTECFAVIWQYIYIYLCWLMVIWLYGYKIEYKMKKKFFFLLIGFKCDFFFFFAFFVQVSEILQVTFWPFFHIIPTLYVYSSKYNYYCEI